MKIIQKNLKNEKNDIQNDYKHKMLKKNKKIKLYSSINKKSLSKIQKSNNLVSTLIEDKNFISNTSGICTNKKTPTKKIPLDKGQKKEKSKPKYEIQINLKDLIKQENKEKSGYSPSIRYADIERNRKRKNKKNEIKYNKPFRFNMNDDY